MAWWNPFSWSSGSGEERFQGESRVIQIKLLRIRNDLKIFEEHAKKQSAGVVKLRLKTTEVEFNKVREKLPLISKNAKLLALYNEVEKKIAEIKTLLN